MSEQQESPGERAPEDAGAAESKQRWFHRLPPGRKLLLPAITLGLLAIILVTFHSILLPFIFACVIVYLMEPVVRRMSAKFPRWVAVITVYLAFFSVLALGFVLVVPRFISELGRFAETVPETISEFRNENLPGINERVQGFFKRYLPVIPRIEGSEYIVARDEVHQAWKSATNIAAATAVAQSRARAAQRIEFQIDREGTAKARRVQREERRAADAEAEEKNAQAADTSSSAGRQPFPTVYRGVPQPPEPKNIDFYPRHGEWTLVDMAQRPIVRVAPGKQGDFELYLDDGEVIVSQLNEGEWSIRRPPQKSLERVTHTDVQASIIDLEARVNEMIESAVSTSQERLLGVIGYTHVLVIGFIQALLTIILTFMVAAFMSIDLHRFVGFFRDLLPSDFRADYDDLLRRVDRGLSGVVRGQLMICVVNGILTYIGLFFLDIKFSVMLALLAGVLSLVPVFGTVISTIPIVLVGLMSGFWVAFLAFVWIMFIHFVEANILNPQIIGTSAHIHPVIVIFALLAGQSAFGLVGALLAVPAASILLEVFKFTRDKIAVQDEEPSTIILEGDAPDAQ